MSSHTKDTVPLEFNPFLPEVREDPYPLYHRLRQADPVFQSFPGLWVLTAYADVAVVLRDPERFSNDSRNSDLFQVFQQSLGDRPPSPMESTSGRTMLFMDPPDHTRLRTLVNKAFTARVVEGMRPHIQEIVDGLLDELLGSDSDTTDVVADLAYPLPVTVICEMLGVPVEDRALFHRWSADLVVTLDPVMSGELLDRANEAAIGFAGYFTHLLADRRAHPRDDLLTALISAEEGGRSFTEEELLSQCILLLVAGHETTVNLISNAVLALLAHPDQLERFRADPGIARQAVEEFLRFDSPVQFVGRSLLADAEVGGKTIRKGQEVIGVIGAANRDPAQFPHPELLDLDRLDVRHLSFGGGIHFCLGAPLARMEGRLALESMVRRLPRLEPAGAPRRRETVTLRGLASLPVRFR